MWLTDAMTEELTKRKLLVPWPLKFDLKSQTVAIEGLKVVESDSYGGAAVRDFVKMFGQVGATLLGAHRLSLFRAGVLLERAHAALRSLPASPASA